MGFDLCEHKIRDLAIRAAREIRKAKDLPEENNITKLYIEAAELLGLDPGQFDSIKQGNHLPTPEESAMANPNNPLVLICPNCGKKSYVINSICQTCKEAKNGKYRTLLMCYECHHSEKSSKWISQIIEEAGLDLPSGMKQYLGIKILTDEGLK